MDAELLGEHGGVERLCYAGQAPMRTLFITAVVALLALLWAAVSIASHVRKARKQRRSESVPEDQTGPE